MAFATCTEPMAENLIRQNLDMRLRFLKSEGLISTYVDATKKQSERMEKLIVEENWDGVCKGVFEVIEIADDILAGGTGRSETLKTPWDKCTPEKMLSLAEEYDLICLPSRRIENCAREELTPLRRELINLKAQLGDDDLKAARYVNRTCELYTEMLKIINE